MSSLKGIFGDNQGRPTGGVAHEEPTLRAPGVGAGAPSGPALGEPQLRAPRSAGDVSASLAGAPATLPATQAATLDAITPATLAAAEPPAAALSAAVPAAPRITAASADAARTAARRRSAVEAAASLRDAFRSDRREAPPRALPSADAAPQSREAPRADPRSPAPLRDPVEGREDAPRRADALRAAMAAASAARPAAPPADLAPEPRLTATPIPRSLSGPASLDRAAPRPVAPFGGLVAQARASADKPAPAPAAKQALAAMPAPAAKTAPAPKTVLERLEAAVLAAPASRPQTPAHRAADAAPAAAEPVACDAASAAPPRSRDAAPAKEPVAAPADPRAAATPAATTQEQAWALRREPSPPPLGARPQAHAEPAPHRAAPGPAFGNGLAGLGAAAAKTRDATPRDATRPALRATPRPAPRSGRRNDPSPSRLRYRLSRLGRRASVQFALRHLAAPLGLVALGVWLWNQEPVWFWAETKIAQVSDAIAARPEFAVTDVSITGGGPRLRLQAREELGLTGPTSSLALDLVALRQRVEALPGVASARLSIGPDGVLRAALTERIPVALWRWDGQLSLVDRDGVVIGPVAERADRPGLPLLIGPGADRAVPEALALVARAGPLTDRLRALVRVGERRWSVALDRDQVIELPAKQAESALGRVLALNAAEDLLARDATVIDIRLPHRPTVRLSPRAVVDLLHLRAMVAGEDA
jgi:cell division protein FtsQ